MFTSLYKSGHENVTPLNKKRSVDNSTDLIIILLEILTYPRTSATFLPISAGESTT